MKKIKTTLFIIMVLLIYFSSNCYALTAQTNDYTKYMPTINGTVVSADDTWEIGDIDNFIMSHAHKRLPADFRTYVRKLIEDAYLKEKIK